MKAKFYITVEPEESYRKVRLQLTCYAAVITDILSSYY